MIWFLYFYLKIEKIEYELGSFGKVILTTTKLLFPGIPRMHLQRFLTPSCTLWFYTGLVSYTKILTIFLRKNLIFYFIISFLRTKFNLDLNWLIYVKISAKLDAYFPRYWAWVVSIPLGLIGLKCFFLHKPYKLNVYWEVMFMFLPWLINMSGLGVKVQCIRFSSITA